MTITQIQALTTQTAAFAGAGVSVSGIVDGSGNPRDWTLKLNVQSLSDSGTATPVVRFAFEDTTNAFTAFLAGPTFSFKGSLSPTADMVVAIKRDMFPDLQIGVASAQLRLHLTDIEATGSVTYTSWLES
jgi:hypothetical protein